MRMSRNSKNKQIDINQGKLAKGVLVNISGKAFGRGIHILSQVILARILGPDGYGLFGIGWIFFRIGSILSTFGLDSGVIHFTSQFWDKDKRQFSEIVISALISAFLIGSLVGLLIFISAGSLADAFNKPGLKSVLSSFAVAIPALAGMTIISAATRVSKDMRKANLIEEVIFPGTTVLLIGIVYIYNGNLNDFVFGSVAAVYISLFLGLFIARTELLTMNVRWTKIIAQFRTLINYSLPVTLPVLFGTLINLVDRIFTGYFLPDVDTGIYQSVSLISALFIAILSAFKTMAAPMFAENYHTGNYNELKAIMRTSTRWVLNLSAPFLLVILVAPQEFIGTLFGESYVAGSQALIILAFAQLINISKGPVDQLLIMTGNQKNWLLVTILAFGVNLVSNWILIPELGIIGAAISQLFTYIVLAAGGIFFAKRKLDIFAYDGRWAINAGLVGITALLLSGIRMIVQLDDLPQLVITIAVSSLVYLLLLVLVGLERTEIAAIRFWILRKTKGK